MGQLALIAQIGMALYGANEKKKTADEESALLATRANAKRAEAGQGVREERRQGRIKQSRAQAVAAAGGADLSDPTLVNLMGDIAAEGEYKALNRLYEGESEGVGLDRSSRIRKREGNAAAASGYGRAAVGLSTALSDSGPTLYEKYGDKTT